MIRRALAAAAILCVLGLRLAPATDARGHIDESIRRQQERLHNVHARLEQKRAQLHDARSRVDVLQSQLAETNRNIGLVQTEIGSIHARMSSTERKLAWTRVQLDAARRTLERHNDALRRRLVDAYEHGDVGYVDVLFASRSFADFVERWNDVRFVIKANEATIRERRAAAAQVNGVERALLGSEALLQQQQAQVAQQDSALAALAGQRKDLLAAADQQRAQVQQEVSQLDDESSADEAQLSALIREKQAEEEARLDAERRARQLAGEAVAPVAGAPGTVMWPVSGPISSPFGMRTNPVTGKFVLHAGIDIAASSGMTVAAAATGRVIIAGWDDGGYGNMVVIDHGGHMSTLYGHMSQIFVGAGQDVERGQAIGAVGSTGHSTGPHLHFEVRVNGNPVDPMSYLR